MKRHHRWASWVVLASAVLLLSGCTEINQPITEESTGIWNEFFVYPLSWLIIQIAGMFSESYGLAIVIVTLMIRLVLLPLFIKQTRSSKAMQEIQPELQALREKYSSKDQKTQQQLQQETMQLFQERKVNPLAGCLPIFVQMPILLAFYHAIMRTGEIGNHTFLWFDLGESDPYFILPIVAGITTFLQQRIMMAGNAQQNPQMMMLMYIMPVMIIVFAAYFPAALALYWVTGNIFMIIQALIVKGPSPNKNGAPAKAEGTKK
ncbi:YidC family membrane integrase SpoIIIJ [Bacillaceae bacterium SIJ1]|uniref:YidC family membrane integrase SpoIIIJ n=1 Tax=Litoribacterium kuwaitense TaxID=1398745 RepID=UPI0013EB6179|nr:YidC family membrane integrase SpoIIIJ [Litoribacterium kuwaitense]NGP45199.1 YidC family membrane integrase SpoIIIJ [Litoribacterium kuwaitense]